MESDERRDNLEMIPAELAREAESIRAAEAEVPHEWNVDDVILGLYEVKEIHTSGGMGLIYRIHHKGWNIDLAVKSPRVNYFQTERQKEIFVRECETWINLGLHPNIVSCYYVRTLGGIPRIFAEYIAGGSLKEWIDNRHLYEGGRGKALERILDIAIQFAWGLQYAHEKGLIHQDVKPSNVMITEEGIAKITDFGLANAQSKAGKDVGKWPEGMSILATYGGMTPPYCSPEQAQIAQLRKAEAAMLPKLTRRTDIWSWGLSVLEMFTGEMAWAAGQAAPEALEGYLEMGTKDESIPKMPDGLIEALRRCFQRNPGDRPHDFVAVADDLRVVYNDVFGDEYAREQPDAIKHIADNLNNHAVSMLDLGRAKQAEQLLEQALAVNPHHVESTYNLGLIQWHKGETDDSMIQKRLKESGTTIDEMWRALTLSAHIALEADDCEMAVSMLENLTGLEAQCPEVQSLMTLARTLLPTSRRCLRTFKGHTRAVSSVVLSADGRHALSGSHDKTLKLWDVATGACLRTFEGHTGYVGSIVLSADGRHALSGSHDETLKLWDVATGACLRTFEGHTGWEISVVLSADGRHALSGSHDKTLKLWDVATGACLRTFEGHTGYVGSIVLSADGRHALSGSHDETLKLWDVATGACLRTFEGHTGWEISVVLSADGRHALSGSYDNTLKLWDVFTGACMRTFEGHIDPVSSVFLSANGRYALSGSGSFSNIDQTLKIWNAATGICLRTFKGHMDSVNSVFLSADGRCALSGSGDKTLKLWNVQGNHVCPAPWQINRPISSGATATTAAQFEKYMREAGEAQLRHVTVEIATALRRARALPGCRRHPKVIDAWSTLYRQLPKRCFAGIWKVQTFKGHVSSVFSVVLSADGRHALSGDMVSMLIWDVTTGASRNIGKGGGLFRYLDQMHKAWVMSVFLSANGRCALSGSRDKTLKLWDVATGACLRTFEGHIDMVCSVVLSADGRHALSGSYDKTLKLWDVATGACLRTFEGHIDKVHSVVLSADGRHALSGSHDKTLKLWDVATGACLQTLERHTGYVSSVFLSADGRCALSGSGDKTLKLWDVATGACLRTLEGHTGGVSSVFLSADGRYALSGSYDKTLKLWDVFTGACLWSFEGHTEGVYSVFLSADGRYALSGSSDKTLKLWRLDWELEDKVLTDWDETSRPYLEVFLTQQMPYTGVMPTDRCPTDDEITQILTRRGHPNWNEADFERLLDTLGCAGLGWLRPDGVRHELEKIASNWQGPPPLLSQ